MLLSSTPRVLRSGGSGVCTDVRLSVQSVMASASGTAFLQAAHLFHGERSEPCSFVMHPTQQMAVPCIYNRLACTPRSRWRPPLFMIAWHAAPSGAVSSPQQMVRFGHRTHAHLRSQAQQLLQGWVG